MQPKVWFTSYKPVKFIKQFCKANNLHYQAKTPGHLHGGVVVNFGSTNPVLTGDYFINHPDAVKKACNKRLAFQALKEKVPTLEWTTDDAVARQWLMDGCFVVGRQLLESHSGNGILLSDADTLPPAGFFDCKLFTKGVRKGREFRVHVDVDGLHVLIQQKRKENGVDVDPVIKTRANGWVFCSQEMPFLDENPCFKDKLVQTAIDSLLALDLNYGAVDIIIHKGSLYVVEVNTAPALKADSVKQHYAKLFKMYATETELPTEE